MRAGQKKPLPLLLTLCAAISASGQGFTDNADHPVARLLLQKKLITADEYQQLSTGQTAPAPHFDFQQGVSVTSVDGRSSARIGTLLQLDGAGYFDDGELDNNSGSEMRRGRFYLSGSVDQDWQYKFEIELFAGSGTEITDAYVRYRGFKAVADNDPLSVSAGHFKIPFSLEQMMSDKDLPLMERSLANALLNSRAPGAMIQRGGDLGSVAVMAFGEQLYNETSNDEGGGLSLRASWAPLHRDRRVLHLGVSAQTRWPAQQTGGSTSRISSRPESHITDIKLLDTGTVGGDVDGIQLYGFEAAAGLGAVVLQAEHLQTRIQRGAARDLRFLGWYAQASWTLSGEYRAYDGANGVFKGINPQYPVGSHKHKTITGAWELALRYSELDLNDADIEGGRERNLTLGLSWFLTRVVRISANWVHVLDVDKGPHDGQPLDALQLRWQFAY